MEGFTESGILTPEEIDNLFTDVPEEKEEKQDASTEEKKQETTEVNPDTLFEQPESVGSEENNEEQEGTTSNKESTSPNKNFYSSITKALMDDSIFTDLNPDEITSAEDFADAIEKQVQNRLDERQKRIDEVLNAGVEPDLVRRYENTINYLKSITQDAISEEGDKGENLRKQLIFQDLVNRGYTQDEAMEEMNEAFTNGTDIKKAERALKSNINFYNNAYKNIVDEAKAAKELEIASRKEQAEALKKEMLSNEKAFGDVSVSQANRQKAYDAISKPVYRDPESGDMLTAVQKYEREHSNDFIKNVGLLYVLTDGFTNLNKLVNDKVKKESKRAIRELENTLNNTQRTSGGSLNFASGVSEDKESIFKGYTLDV